MAKVAVENNLTDVKEALQSSGYEVVSIDNMTDVSCCVITGQDKNMMGITETTTQASVINAEGLTAQEIVEQVNRCVEQNA
jgi:hypothetical protein